MADISVVLFPGLPGLRSRHWRLECYGSSKPFTPRSALIDSLPDIAKDSWDVRFAWGGLYVNGRKMRDLDQTLEMPWRIDYYEAIYDINAPEKEFPTLARSAVVFQDSDLVIVYKPAGLPCLPGCEQQHFHLSKSLKDLGFGPKLHFASRLDTAAQGLVPVACSSSMEKRLQSMYEKRRISKRYLLLVQGRTDWNERTVEIGIDRSTEHTVLRIASPRGKQALTHFRKVDEFDGRTILEAEPKTGRTHQLRVHCQYLGLPIVGDRFYGGPDAKELGLVCSRLILPYPGRGDELDITAPEGMMPEWAG